MSLIWTMSVQTIISCRNNILIYYPFNCLSLYKPYVTFEQKKVITSFDIRVVEIPLVIAIATIYVLLALYYKIHVNWSTL